MEHHFKEHIITPSLEILKNDSRIKRFYFFPGLLSVIFISVLLMYQAVYTYVVLLGNKDALLNIIIDIFHSDYATSLIIGSIIFFIFYTITTPIFEGALIRYIDQKNKWEASRGDSIGFGIFRFYPLFEFNNLTAIFKFMSIVNGYLFSLRFLWLEYITGVSIFFFIALLFSVILNLFIAYARYEIVLHKKWVFEAIGISSQITLLNISLTLRLYFMMFIMNIKIIINFFIFLIFPILSAIILWFISSQFFATIILIILWLIFLFLLLILGYLAASLEIFTSSIWYYAYKIWKKKLEAVED